MRILEGKVTVEISGNYPEHTAKFVALLASMINKGIDNSSMQLHMLSIITTGEPFTSIALPENHAAADLTDLQNLFAILMTEATRHRSKKDLGVNVQTLTQFLNEFDKGKE